MTRQRAVAVVLLIVSFLGGAATRRFPYMSDFPEAAKIAITVAAAACLLLGVRLWVGKSSDSGH